MYSLHDQPRRTVHSVSVSSRHTRIEIHITSSILALYERILDNLRCEVDQIRDSEILEQNMPFGPQDTLDQPSTNDVEEILRNMMSGSSLSTTTSRTEWADESNHSFATFGSSVRASSSAAGKRDKGSRRLAG